MKSKTEIEIHVRNLFRRTFILYVDNYYNKEDAAKQFAKRLWVNRDQYQIKQDNRFDVTIENYVEWVTSEYDELNDWYFYYKTFFKNLNKQT